MTTKDIYKDCPTFDTAHFHLRLVRESDAEDLLACYGDPAACAFMNSDNCTFGYDNCDSTEKMNHNIRLWLGAYERCEFIRWAIVDKNTNKAVGTVEMFCASKWNITHGIDGGCLRIDICSAYETATLLSELIHLANDNFFTLFGAKIMVSKAIPEATERIAALEAIGFVPYEVNAKYKHFYAKESA